MVLALSWTIVDTVLALSWTIVDMVFCVVLDYSGHGVSIGLDLQNGVIVVFY